MSINYFIDKRYSEIRVISYVTYVDSYIRSTSYCLLVPTPFRRQPLLSNCPQAFEIIFIMYIVTHCISGLFEPKALGKRGSPIATSMLLSI